MMQAFGLTVGRTALVAGAALALFLAHVPPVEAGLDQWTDLGLPGTASVNAVLVIPNPLAPGGPKLLYVATPSGLFRTTLGSGTWVAITTDDHGRSLEPILSLAVDPARPSRLVAGAGVASRVYVSADAGSSWQRHTVDSSQAASQIFAVALNPLNDSEIIAGTSDGLWVSTDDGHQFDAYRGLSGCLDVHAVAIDYLHPDIRYAGTNCGLFKTTDGANTQAVWDQVKQRVFDLTGGGSHLEDVIGNNVASIALGPVNPDNVYAGTLVGDVFKIQSDGSGGVNISPMSQNNGFVATPLSALVVDPQNTGVIYAATEGQGIFKGKTAAWGRWLRFNVGLADLQVSTLAIDAGDPRKLYAGSGAGHVFAIEQTSVLPPAADLALSAVVIRKGVPPAGLPAFVYKITLTNHGPGAAVGAKVTIAFVSPRDKPAPAGSIVVTDMKSSQGACQIRFINCGIGQLGPGASATITLAIKPQRALLGGTLVAKISVVGQAANDIWGVPDAHPADNEKQVSVTVR